MRDASGAPLLDSMALLSGRLERPLGDEDREREGFVVVFLVELVESVPRSVASDLVVPLSEVVEDLRAMMGALSCGEGRAARHRHAACDATPVGGGRACEVGSGGHFGVLHKECAAGIGIDLACWTLAGPGQSGASGGRRILLSGPPRRAGV
jgi:hypothetical protein